MLSVGSIHVQEHIKASITAQTRSADMLV